MKKGFSDYLSKSGEGNKLISMLKKCIPFNKVDEEKTDNEEEVKAEVDEELKFINMETAMKYCADSEEIFKEVLVAYLEGDKREQINEFYKNEDWENYRILIHSLKSTSLTIGAEQLHEQAKLLEMAAKEGDYEYIRNTHNDTMKQYGELLDNISTVVNGKNAYKI